MGIIVLSFYFKYLIILIVAVTSNAFVFRKIKYAMIIFFLGLAFPIADVLFPWLIFRGYCQLNLKYINTGPVQNVDGFYSESTEGVCQHCRLSTFLNGYKFVEGRVDKRRKKYRETIATLKSLNEKVPDKHGTLYRFSLISTETNKELYQCNRPNISISQRMLHLEGLPIGYVCFKAEKIDKPKANYNVLASKTKNQLHIIYNKKYTQENIQIKIIKLSITIILLFLSLRQFCQSTKFSM